MKKDAIYLAIIVLLLGFVVVMTCSGPDPVDTGKQVYTERDDSLIHQLAIKDAQIDSAVAVANTLSKEKDSVVVVFTRKITRLTRNASQARTARVDTLIKSDPELLVFVETQDSVIHQQGILIDTLKSQIAFERGVRESLMTMHYDSDKITANLLELRSQRIITLEKDLKKEKRKGRFKAVLIPIIGVAAFLLGSQL